jgi:hypothetical protein
MNELYKFRWNHYHKIDKVIDIAIFCIGISAIILGILSLLIDISAINGGWLFGIAILIIFVMFESIYRQGRLDQKYLNEMNEIRIKLKRKPMKDI